MAEILRANMAAADVLLDTFLTIMSFIGSNTSKMALLALRRPLLAYLVSPGAQLQHRLVRLSIETQRRCLKEQKTA
ncbi:hypothetical protein BP5796_08946 [Coleophoma crateriformis]|uniref:Uncharacterized protein n=1 Tax=Coleophoma crateriformis TaxID=565419 RepID=A0A3D8R2M6_9HELO|nr:hypothetical protein BP5796_08946 [Coleophoma crateriformis]